MLTFHHITTGQDGKPNAKEIVALMGAHTIGKFDVTNSGFKYFWTRAVKIISNRLVRIHLNNKY